MSTKAIFIPGNGGGTPQDNWFPYLENALKAAGVHVINVQFPDSELARKEYWLPFIESLNADEKTVLVGHSSGAIAALKFSEKHRILGSVLVGVYHTDLGYESEKLSGYFDEPWDWEAIKNNQKWILEFASTDDPFIPIEEARFVKKKSGAEYYEYTNQGHFGHGFNPKHEFPELLSALLKKLEIVV